MWNAPLTFISRLYCYASLLTSSFEFDSKERKVTFLAIDFALNLHLDVYLTLISVRVEFFKEFRPNKQSLADFQQTTDV